MVQLGFRLGLFDEPSHPPPSQGHLCGNSRASLGRFDMSLVWDFSERTWSCALDSKVGLGHLVCALYRGLPMMCLGVRFWLPNGRAVSVLSAIYHCRVS